MTRGELLELAFQAGLATDDGGMPNGFAEYCRRLERFADLVAAAERDRVYLKARGEAIGGASLRDYFAAKAMQSLLTTVNEFPDEHWRAGVAIDAYMMADAMLADRGVKS